MASEQNQQSPSTIAMLWPTPVANDHKSIYASEETHAKAEHPRPLREVVGVWTTPSAGDGSRGGTITERMSGTSLTQQVNTLWSTPRSSDAEKGGPNQAFGAGGTPLPAQASQWRTPRSHEVGQYQYDRGDKEKPTPTLTGQALASLLPDRPISTDGDGSSHIRRTLNPLFVEWLMGWPPGWTSLGLTPLASSGCACSATAFTRWQRRMQSELSQLGLPAQAPAAQLALFG